MATIKSNQAGIRSFVTFLSLSLLVAILFILTGSYGSFIDILVHTVMAGAVGWLIWNGFKFIHLSKGYRQRLQHIMSGGGACLTLFNWNHNPYFVHLTEHIAGILHIPASVVQSPLAFTIGGALGAVIYWLNKDIDKNIYRRRHS